MVASDYLGRSGTQNELSHDRLYEALRDLFTYFVYRIMSYIYYI